MKQIDDMRAAAQAFWQRRSAAERLQIGMGAAVASLLILVFGVLLPLQEARQRLAAVVAREQARSVSMTAISAELARLGSLPHAETPEGEALRSVVEASARAAFAPSVVVVTQEGAGFRMHAAGVSFAQVIKWIDSVRQNQHMRLVNASIRPDAGTTCTVSLLLAGAAQ